MDATIKDKHHHHDRKSRREKTPSIGLQTLKPCRNVPRPNNEHPIEYVGLLAFVFMTWLDGFMWRVFRRGLPQTEVWACPPADTAEHNAPILERMWQEELDTKKEKASLFRVAFKFARGGLIVATVIILVDFCITTIAQTVVYMKLFEYLWQDKGEEDWGVGYGIALVVALFFIQIGYSLCIPVGFTVATLMAVRIRAAIAFMVFKKILNSRNLGGKSTGHYVNIFANDSTRILEGFINLPIILVALYLLVGPTVYSILLLDEYALIGFVFILLVFPIQVLIGKQIIRVRQRANPLSDKRVKMMKETLENAKSVKMFAWEAPFSNMINGIRETEMTHIAQGNTVMSFSLILSTIMIGMAIMITIIVSAVTGKQVTNVEIFTYVILYSTFNGLYNICIQAFKHLSECLVALRRCQEIMEEPDHFTEHENVKSNHDNPIELNQANVVWPLHKIKDSKAFNDQDPEMTVALNNISLLIKRESTTGIAGPVGSGKSALIGAMLGKLDVLDGSCNVHGSVAYVPQHPWIFNASLRDNILFHMPFDKKRYSAILDACCLVHDISLLPDGDLSEIGERGVNLSGGQKHRINIARALYSDRDIVLMDDPFSALDPDIAEDIFRNAILDLLQRKTVVLVTHEVRFLPHCDHVVFMDHGEIRQQGTHEELINRDQVYEEYTRTVESSEFSNRESEDLLPPKVSTSCKDMDRMTHPAQSLMAEESCQAGAVSTKTYWSYISAAGGVSALVLALFVSLLAEGVRAFSFWWLGEWLADGSGNTTLSVTRTITMWNGTSEIITESMISPFISDNPNVRFYVLVYGMSLVGIIVVYVLRSFVIMRLMKRASTRLHKQLFTKVLGSPMQFFDTTPIGQIINRFSKDQDEIDSGMPPEVDNLLTVLTRVLMYFVLIGAIVSWSFLVIPLMTLIFVLFYCLYRAGMREMKRHHNVSWSPLLGLVTNSVLGLSCVRAYAKEDEFKRQFCKDLNYNTATLIGYHLIKWWCVQRMVLITATNISIVVLIIVFLKSYIPPAMAAVTMTYGLQIAGMALVLVLTAVETQTRFTSVERISDYIDNLEQEKNSFNAKTGSSNWPKSGAIEFINYDMRYRPGLPLVLKNLTFSVDDHEKIGVVGRSGAGKSSLTNALFRLCEAAAGKILISGVDISTVSLEQLRSNIAIIPQEPLLFSGSIRTNLDPFDQFNDCQLWEALDRCHMKTKISSMAGQLSAFVTEHGKNLSAGERQLICLARVLLKQTRVLILDEATASVDSQTSRKIQQCLHEVLQDCTMLVIAHRLETVMKCEKVLVISDGQVVEFDKPENLAQDVGSHFYRLMIDAQDL